MIIICCYCSYRRRIILKKNKVPRSPIQNLAYYSPNLPQDNQNNRNNSPLPIKSDFEQQNCFPEIHPVNLMLFPDQSFDKKLKEDPNRNNYIEERKENTLPLDYIQENGGIALFKMKKPNRKDNKQFIYDIILKYHKENQISFIFPVVMFLFWQI